MTKKKRKSIKIYSIETREEKVKKILKALIGEKGTRTEKKIIIDQTFRDLGKKHYDGMNGTIIREDNKKWGLPWLEARRRGEYTHRKKQPS